jgi:metal-dependent amidase/aminoacylase/carboxypeptidase family protein
MMADAAPVRSRAAPPASQVAADVQRQLIADLERKAEELRQRFAADLTATLTAVADDVRQQLVADVNRVAAAVTASIRDTAVPVAVENAVSAAEMQRIVAESKKQFLADVETQMRKAVERFEKRLATCERNTAYLWRIEAYALGALGATGADIENRTKYPRSFDW